VQGAAVVLQRGPRAVQADIDHVKLGHGATFIATVCAGWQWQMSKA
jgi:hypothetical protein